jgi:hypothetical protein
MADTGWKYPKNTYTISGGIDVSSVSNIANNADWGVEQGDTDITSHRNAYVTLPEQRYSDFICGYNYAFGLNPNARVDGILAKLVYAGAYVRDNYAKIIYNGDALDDKSKNSYRSDSNFKIVGYGAGNDKWGASKLYPSILNSSDPNDLRFAVSLKNIGTSDHLARAYVLGLKAYFTNPTYSESAALYQGGAKVSSVNQGQQFNYTLTLKNTNSIHNGVAIPVSLVLPSGISYVSATGNGTYNNATGKWNATLVNGTATLTLTLVATTPSTKVVNASVDGLPTTLNTTIPVIALDNELNVTVTAPETMELAEESTFTINVSGNIYTEEVNILSVDMPGEFDIKNGTILSSSNISNVQLSGNNISFDRTSQNIYAVSLVYQVTIKPRLQGENYINVYDNATGASGADLVNVTCSGTYITSNQVLKSYGTSATVYSGFIDVNMKGCVLKAEVGCKLKADILYGYIGPIQLDKNETHELDGLVNTVTQTLIEDIYKNRENIGKKGDFKEEMPLTIKLPNDKARTLRELVYLDEPIPMNIVVSCEDGDPFNFRGYYEVYECANGFFNFNKMQCKVKLKPITGNLKPPIYVHRLSQPNRYSLKGQYPVELLNDTILLADYFNVVCDGNVNDKIFTLTGTQSLKLTSKTTISDPATIDLTWATNKLADTERIIRILDENKVTLLEYTLNPLDDTGLDIEGNIDITDYDDGNNGEEVDVDLAVSEDGTTFSTRTLIQIEDNVVNIIEEGASEQEFSYNFILEESNYYIEIEHKHIASTDSITTFAFNIDETHLLTTEKSYYINQICSSFAIPGKVVEYTREAEDGLIWYYRHDETVSKYYTDPFNIYKGGTNVTTESGVSLLSNRYSVDPICITNGLVKVMFSFKYRMIWLYLWDWTLTDTDKWVLAGRFTLSNMENIKVYFITQDKAIMSVGGTLWTIIRGRPWIDITHPQQAIYIVDKKDTVWRDNGSGAGTETTLGETKTLLSLNNLYYLLLYNQTDKYGIQIIKPGYESIYNTMIPADDKTVLIPYKKSAKDYDSPTKLALEWVSVWEQKINFNE